VVAFSDKIAEDMGIEISGIVKLSTADSAGETYCKPRIQRPALAQVNNDNRTVSLLRIGLNLRTTPKMRKEAIKYHRPTRTNGEE
jgi:hypothetical protein